MKKSTRNVLIVVIIILFILCLISFNVNGVKKLFSKSNMSYMFTPDVEDEMAYERYAVAETMAASGVPMARQSMKAMTNDMVTTLGTAEIPKENEIGATERKLIKNISIDCETQDFDGTYDLVERKVVQYDGIVDSENFNNYQYNSKAKRNCYFNIRIPKEKVDNFVGDIAKNVNILNKSESVEDVTDNYYDTVARMKNYQIEEEKLQELMKKATRVEDLITIEEKLQNVRYQIESIQRRIKNLDKRIDYSNVNISLSEVVVYTRPEDVKPTKDGLITAFKKNFEDTKNFIINTGYYIFTHIPAICLALCVGLVLLIIVIIIVTIIDGPGKKKETNASMTSSIQKEIKAEVKKEIKKEEKKAKEEIKKEDIKKEDDELEGSGLGKSVMKDKVKDKKEVKTYEDLKEKLEENAQNKKTGDGFTMTDLDFTSTK